MSLILTDISALHAWRDPQVWQSGASPASCAVVPHGWEANGAAVARRVEETPFLQKLPQPLHLLVPDRSKRRSYGPVVPHVCPQGLVNRRVHRVAPGVYVVSPEACLLQLVRGRSPVSVLKVVYELCGGFARNGACDAGFLERPPLTSVARIRRFLERLPPRTHNADKLARVLRYACDGSRSPMESVLAMHLVLPSSQGGYGFALPVLNARIPVPRRLRDTTRSRTFYGDLVWPRFHVALEYDSDLFHEGASRRAADAHRGNLLELMGMRVIPVTRGQIMDVVELNTIAKRVAGYMGKRALPQAADYRTKQLQLRAELLNVNREL